MNILSKRIPSIAFVFALSALLSVSQVRAEEASFVELSAPTPQPTRSEKVLRAFAWPAYGLSPRFTPTEEDRSKLGRTEKFVLAGERLSFMADATTTQLGLSQGHESDPLNSLFGSTNRVGVLGSMTAWEMGFSYTSVAVPRWLEHTRFHKAAQVVAIAGGAALTGFRVKMVVQNSQFIR
ncbi:MAG: hypothetical protein ACLPH3_06325 [Terracidiphilus sp.]